MRLGSYKGPGHPRVSGIRGWTLRLSGGDHHWPLQRRLMIQQMSQEYRQMMRGLSPIHLACCAHPVMCKGWPAPLAWPAGPMAPTCICHWGSLRKQHGTRETMSRFLVEGGIQTIPGWSPLLDHLGWLDPLQQLLMGSQWWDLAQTGSDGSVWCGYHRMENQEILKTLQLSNGTHFPQPRQHLTLQQSSPLSLEARKPGSGSGGPTVHSPMQPEHRDPKGCWFTGPHWAGSNHWTYHLRLRKWKGKQWLRWPKIQIQVWESKVSIQVAPDSTASAMSIGPSGSMTSMETVSLRTIHMHLWFLQSMGVLDQLNWAGRVPNDATQNHRRGHPDVPRSAWCSQESFWLYQEVWQTNWKAKQPLSGRN